MTDPTSPVPEPGGASPGVYHGIYGMPMFATLEVSAPDDVVSWYVDGLGFVVLFTIPGPDGRPALVHLRRWAFQDLLVRPATSGTTTTETGWGLSMAAVVDEIDDLAARATAHGGGTVEPPVDTPWNTRDLVTRDPEGHRLTFTAGRRPDATTAAFSESMRQWSDEQGGHRRTVARWQASSHGA